ncbi:hypothetical protein F8O01_15265 [Pseudoclavibacter chungangensis]|uniref:Leucine-rich repeat domain-containing protein n=1 Tax=Pseudoclavibacter chungangensis TaxID=587635 RepID=A0A7J5BN70_9MICO|nr:hypothetical protein [Pseudoclavibacter chungangensis]KAB1653427.1 hypothetical protein F8O01_15265 [Pseudoclavibacter chungangensis]NYJ66363.1 hypothetical protein [Pseudoclavibacter chungangensis]
MWELEWGTDPVARALAAIIGRSETTALFDRFMDYSNYRNVIAGTAKRPADPPLETAALQLFRDPALARDLDIETDDPVRSRRFGAIHWGLLTLAARADASVLDALPAEVRAESDDKIRKIARAAKKHATTPTATAADAAAPGTPSDLPSKVSEVRTWLKTHPDADPEVLAPSTTQRAPERRAALRALGQIGTPAALDVLARYARARWSAAELDELHAMWGRFDRRAFASRMFVPSSWRLDLGSTTDLDGIDAVAGLTGLAVRFGGTVDLGPLAACTGLQRLWVSASDDPGMTSLEPLTHLPALTDLHLRGVTRNADLEALTDIPIARLPAAHAAAPRHRAVRGLRRRRSRRHRSAGPGPVSRSGAPRPGVGRARARPIRRRGHRPGR